MIKPNRTTKKIRKKDLDIILKYEYYDQQNSFKKTRNFKTKHSTIIKMNASVRTDIAIPKRRELPPNVLCQQKVKNKQIQVQGRT